MPERLLESTGFDINNRSDFPSLVNVLPNMIDSMVAFYY